MKILITIFLAYFISISAFAQSQFVGAYGQISTGYENNTVSSATLTGTNYGSTPNTSNSVSTSTSSAPLVLGVGYVFPVQDKFTLGLGVDYYTLTQETSPAAFYYRGISTATYNYKFTISNRFNIFITPGYS